MLVLSSLPHDTLLLDFKSYIRNEWMETIKKKLYKSIPANTSATWQRAAHLITTHYHRPSPQQQLFKKAYLFNNYVEEFFAG